MVGMGLMVILLNRITSIGESILYTMVICVMMKAFTIMNKRQIDNDMIRQAEELARKYNDEH